MLEVTDETLLYLSRVLEERKAPPDTTMRLSRESTKLLVAPDTEQPGDRGFDFNDRTVLVVNRVLAEQMDGQRLSLLENSSGQPELRLEPK